MPLSPGDVVAGKYRIERLLGEGGMGRVYAATHGVLRKQIALKVMIARFTVSPDAVERFFREAVAASKVEHPAIVQVFDAGVHEESPFIAMELLRGEDLDQRLERDGALSVEETLWMARPILSALEAAHRVGVVHRDIKPPNIFLAQRADGVVIPKLLDFGIAKHINDPLYDNLTQKGSVLGTPLYLAPEQAESDSAADHRADIYSIGVTLFHCLAGTTPYQAKTFPELIGKLFTEPPRDLAELAPHVPPLLCSWIQRCLAHDPKRRPQSAQALLDGLNAIESGERNLQSPAASARTELPPTRIIPMDYSDHGREDSTAAAAPIVGPTNPPPRKAAHSEDAWAAAGIETSLDSGAALKKKRSGSPVLLAVALLFFTVCAGIALWVFVGDGGAKIEAWIIPARGEDPPAVLDPDLPPIHTEIVDAGLLMRPSARDSGLEE